MESSLPFLAHFFFSQLPMYEHILQSSMEMCVSVELLKEEEEEESTGREEE